MYPIIILVNIEIIMPLINIEKTIGTQNVRLVYLKVETDGMHNN
jgi:hypothetical protein